MPPKRNIEKALKSVPKRKLRSSEDNPRGESKEEEPEENDLRDQSDAEASEKADDEEEQSEVIASPKRTVIPIHDVENLTRKIRESTLKRV
jgi:hypothetical protein